MASMIHREVDLFRRVTGCRSPVFLFSASENRVAGVARLRAADPKGLNSGEAQLFLFHVLVGHEPIKRVRDRVVNVVNFVAQFRDCFIA